VASNISNSPIGDLPSWRNALIAAVGPGVGPPWVAAGDAAQAAAELRMVPDIDLNRVASLQAGG